MFKIFKLSLRLQLVFCFFSSSLFSQSNSDKLQVTPLTANFYIYTTYNTYKEYQVPANGMYLLTEQGAVVFDTPWDTTQFQPLIDYIKKTHAKDIVLCIATHSHEDRTGGLEYFKRHGIKTYTTVQTDQISTVQHQKRAEFLIEKDTLFKVGSYSFQTFYPGKGHAPDNIVIWFDKEKILYGGCLIKSTEARDLGYLGDASVDDWTGTINNIQTKFGKPKFIIPGHNSWKSTNSLKHTLKLLRKYKAVQH